MRPVSFMAAKRLDPMIFHGWGCDAANGHGSGLPSAGLEGIDSMQELADGMNIGLLGQEQGSFR